MTIAGAAAGKNIKHVTWPWMRKSTIMDFQRLCEPYPFPGGRFCHTCLDTETNTLYVYGEEAEGRPAYLKVFKPDEEE